MEENRKHINLSLFTYSRAGNIAYIKILGIPIYQKVGNVRKILFWVIRAKNDSE